jgi:hypothetical protein
VESLSYSKVSAGYCAWLGPQCQTFVALSLGQRLYSSISVCEKRREMVVGRGRIEVEAEVAAEELEADC